MLFSRACEYGIRAMLYLATKTGSGPVLVRDVAKELRMPFPFLAKITQSLARQGLVSSHKGPGGGITLARPPEEVTMLEVVEAIDGLNMTQACVLGIPQCSDEVPCPLHGQWGDIRKRLVDMLSKQNLAEVASDLKNREYVLVRT